MYDGGPSSTPLAGLEVLGPLDPPDTLAARHPTLGPCVIQRFDGPDAPAAAEQRSLPLVRAHGRGILPGIKRTLGVMPTTSGGWCLVTSFLPGVSLDRAERSRFREAPRTLGELGIALLHILEGLHRRRIVHGRISARHVIIGSSVGLVGLGEPGAAMPADDLRAVGALLYELATGEPHAAGAPSVLSQRPELGRALDEWLDELNRGSFEDAAEARAYLHAVTGSLPPAGELPRARIDSSTRPTFRSPSQGGSESLTPPSSEMQARIA